MAGPWEKYQQQGMTQIAPADPRLPAQVQSAQLGNRKAAQDIGIDAAANNRADIELKAKLYSMGLQLDQNGSLAPIQNWKPVKGADTQRAAQLRDRVTAMTNLSGVLKDLQGQYDRNFKGAPANRLFGLTEMLPGVASAKNQTFNDSALRAGPFIQSILGLTGKESDAAAEYERKVMPFIPSAGKFDDTNESKLRNLWDFLQTQRAATYGELGVPVPRYGKKKQQANTVMHFDKDGNLVQ